MPAGISAESAGATGLCMVVLTIPPGQKAKAHKHEGHETAIYALSGELVMWWGERLENRMVVREGDMLYIPAGVPHRPGNEFGQALRRGDRPDRSQRAGERGADAGAGGSGALRAVEPLAVSRPARSGRLRVRPRPRPVRR